MAAGDPSPKDRELIERLTQIVLANLTNEQFGVNGLANEIGYSRSYLYRKLRLLKQQSISQFIRVIRLQEAYKLLQDGKLTASEVAYRVGFNNPSYFNSCFHAYYGFSPGMIKRSSQIVTEGKALNRKPGDNAGPLWKRKLFWPAALLLLMVLIPAGLLMYKALRMDEGEKSIAILPLANLTGYPENDYFVAGMHDALISELSQFASLRVVSRTSTLDYHDTSMSLKELASELDVSTLLEGSVTGIGDSIRLMVRLIELEPEEHHLLSREYRDIMSNVLNVQTQVARDVADRMDLKLSKVEKQLIRDARAVDPEIYRSYLRGMYYMNQGSRESLDKGIEYLHDAIDLDPGDPFAYAALSLGYAIRGQEHIDPDEAFLSAIYAADKAVRLDSTMDIVHTARALLYLYQSWEWEKARASFERAIAINPNNAIAYAHFARYYLLFQDLDKALYHAKMAVNLEPFSPSYLAGLALLYYLDHEYEEAEFWARKSLKLKADLPGGILVLGWIALENKQYEQAVEYHQKLPLSVYYQMHLGQTYVKSGQRDKAIALWKEMENRADKGDVNPCYMGMMAAYLGYTDKAFSLLSQACTMKSYPIIYLDLYPCSEKLRGDPRYAELFVKMNLPYKRP
jgi:TolB-like protein/AraC-like DNA-binding protein/Tfp pilus assembly protein PilF